jgi:glycerol-3-phosphate dehydrogenase
MLAETAMREIEAVLGRRMPAWTEGAALPGGDFEPEGLEPLIDRLAGQYPFAEPDYIGRLVRHYGTRARTILGKAAFRSDLGRHFGAGLYEAELRYLIAQEWAVAADDVLFRRTKLGLHMNESERRQVEDFMRARRVS